MLDNIVMFFSASKIVPGAVVGTIHNPHALVAAQKLRPGAVDFLELRVDAFAALPHADEELTRVESVAGSLPAPLIVTVRHPKEGGSGQLPAIQRRNLLERFLPHATLIDVELRSTAQLSDVLREARTRGIGTILSHHDFKATPSLKRLQELARRAREAECTIFKVATMAHTAKALTTLMQFLTSQSGVPCVPTYSVMGMGDFGKISRLVLAQAGSVLNYGFLDKLQVPGQWPAELLKKRLLELREPLPAV